MGSVVEIKKCLCHDKTFKALKQVAEHSGASTLEALEEEVSFGQQCGRCRPYVRKMLETGDISFTTLITED